MDMPTQLKVLFLEDDADTRDLVAFTLRRSGIDVVLAKTATEAWTLANNETFDLYLLDGLIPDGDSIELCRNLREASPSKPIVFYSGLAFKADIQRGLDAGANRYLVKPFDGNLAETILQTINGGSAPLKTSEHPEPAIPRMSTRAGLVTLVVSGIV